MGNSRNKGSAMSAKSIAEGLENGSIRDMSGNRADNVLSQIYMEQNSFVKENWLICGTKVTFGEKNGNVYYHFCCSVANLCLTVCYLINCSILGFPILHSLPEFAQTHVHWVMSLSQRCYPTISSSATPISFCPQSFPVSGSFPMSQLFTSVGQSIGTSVSATDLPKNIQGWFPLGLTGLISLLSKDLSWIPLKNKKEIKQSLSQYSLNVLWPSTTFM